MTNTLRVYAKLEYVKMIDPELLEDGLHEGINIFLHGCGRLKMIVTYLNGMLNGPYVVYYEDGLLQEKGTFLNGCEVGPWQWHDVGHEFSLTGVWVNGELTEQKESTKIL